MASVSKYLMSFDEGSAGVSVDHIAAELQEETVFDILEEEERKVFSLEN